jgi:VanZ family protein
MKFRAVLFSLFIIAIIILADLGLLGPVKQIYNIPYGDKAGHLILFGILNYFITLAALESRNPSNPKRLALFVAFLLALVIAIEEISQLLFPKRTFELQDLLAGYIGVAIGSWLGLKAFISKKKAQSA